MARRTREEAQVTREQLLDAAVRIFRRRGVSNTSLAEIADAAGVTRGAVYWHFKDKADLFQAMVDREVLPFDAAVEDLARVEHQHPLDALRDATVRVLQHLADSDSTQAVFDIVFHRCEFTDDLAVVHERRQRECSDCLAKFEASFKQAVKRKQLPADTDTALAARAIFSYVGGLMRNYVEAPDRFDLRRAAPMLIDTILAGLRSAPPRRAKPARKPRAALKPPAVQRARRAKDAGVRARLLPGQA